MSRYYTLVVVPGDADAPEEACEAAAELLYPYMYNPDELTKTHNFTDHMWPVSEILEPQTFAGLDVEAIVTPEGTRHEPDDPGQLWDDPAWLNKARQVLKQHRECLSLRHVLHI